MYAAQLPETTIQKRIGVIIVAFFFIWVASQAVSQGGHNQELVLASASTAVEGIDSHEATASNYLSQPAFNETEESQGWFIVDEESQWADQERVIVEQVMERTWDALASVGLDGADLLSGYRFRRLASEFVPGEGRLLAIVDHDAGEIILATGAFERLHGFYIYHELGHAVDRQLARLPSEAYHRIANANQAEPARDSDTWTTATGFWLRYHGRDDREEATADAFAWWVMAQADQPQPFFPGTPVTTDYDEIARTIEEAVREAAATGFESA